MNGLSKRALIEAYKRGLKKGMKLTESFEDPSAGIEQAKNELMQIKNKLQTSRGSLSPEEYAKLAAKMFKMMEQLISRNGEDNVAKVFGGDLEYYFHQNNTPDWLRQAVKNGETDFNLIRAALKGSKALPGIETKNTVRNYNKWQRRSAQS